jgi:hypothetical protein
MAGDGTIQLKLRRQERRGRSVVARSCCVNGLDDDAKRRTTESSLIDQHLLRRPPVPQPPPAMPLLRCVTASEPLRRQMGICETQIVRPTFGHFGTANTGAMVHSVNVRSASTLFSHGWRRRVRGRERDRFLDANFPSWWVRDEQGGPDDAADEDLAGNAESVQAKADRKSSSSKTTPAIKPTGIFTRAPLLAQAAPGGLFLLAFSLRRECFDSLMPRPGQHGTNPSLHVLLHQPPQCHGPFPDKADAESVVGVGGPRGQ